MYTQKVKYQIITVAMLGTGDDATIETTLDKQFKTVDKIFMYGGTGFQISTNQNVEFLAGLYINNREIFPTGFMSALLFPYPEHEKFTDNINGEAGGTTIKVRVLDTGNGGTPYTLTILVVLKDRGSL